MHSYTVRDSSSYLLSVPGNSSLPKVIDLETASTLSATVERWTHGHPLLKGIIQKYVVRYSAQILRQEGAGVVNEIVRQKIIKNWTRNEAANYLNAICDVLLSSAHTDRVLITYMQVLSRGGLPCQQDPRNQPEQALLLRSGLVKYQENQLVVSNAVCAAVFDMAWIEQQVPGLTRGVAIVKPPRAEDQPTIEASLPSKGSKQYSKIAVVGCGVALLSAVLSSYVREDAGNRVAASTAEARPDATTDFAIAADRVHFDQGTALAANGQWSDMLQQFCALSTSSVYFAPASKQLERWVTLYPTEIQSATGQLSADAYSQCAIFHHVN